MLLLPSMDIGRQPLVGNKQYNIPTPILQSPLQSWSTAISFTILKYCSLSHNPEVLQSLSQSWSTAISFAILKYRNLLHNPEVLQSPLQSWRTVIPFTILKYCRDIILLPVEEALKIQKLCSALNCKKEHFGTGFFRKVLVCWSPMSNCRKLPTWPHIKKTS